MSSQDASDLAHRLGRRAEAACRHYLSHGTRIGRYWLVGDVLKGCARAFRRAIGPQAPRPGNGCGRVFFAAACGRFVARSKRPGLRHPPLRCGPTGGGVQVRAARGCPSP